MNEIAVCGDCLFAREYDDYSGIPAEWCETVRAGVKKLGWYTYIEDLGFKTGACECCGSKLHGNRYLFREMEINDNVWVKGVVK